MWMNANANGRHGTRRRDRIVWQTPQTYRLRYMADLLTSDYTGTHTKLKKILLNGNNVAMVCVLTRYCLSGNHANMNPYSSYLEECQTRTEHIASRRTMEYDLRDDAGEHRGQDCSNHEMVVTDTCEAACSARCV